MSCQWIAKRRFFPATILFTSVCLPAISLAAQTAQHPAQDFQKNGKNFDSAYGAVSDASGLFMEAMYLPPVTTWPWSPAWSPDAHEIGKITFSMQGSLWEIPVAGGEAVQLTSGSGYDSEPAWSPDGSEVAFVRDNDQSIQIWVMKADGSSAHAVTRTGNANVDPRWSRDGKSILCTSSAGGKGFGLWVASIEDGTMRPVVEDQHQNITPFFGLLMGARDCLCQQSAMGRKGNRWYRGNLEVARRRKRSFIAAARRDSLARPARVVTGWPENRLHFLSGREQSAVGTQCHCGKSIATHVFQGVKCLNHGVVTGWPENRVHIG